MINMKSCLTYLLILTVAQLLECSPIEETLTRSTVEETRKLVGTPSKAVNLSSHNILLDVRTPPKIRLKQDKVKYENSHPGVAIPVDEDSINIEDSATKKFNFYKIERPTTDSSISTWILLSGQPITTNKPISINKTDNRDVIVPIYNRTRPTTVVETAVSNKEKIKFTEINKASTSKYKKKSPTTTTTQASSFDKIEEKSSTVEKKNDHTTSTTVFPSIRSTSYSDRPILKDKKTTPTPVTTSTESARASTTLRIDDANSSLIALEAKDGSVNLTNDKKKNSTNKKKKNKRKKKPTSKIDTSLNTTTKIKEKNQAIGAQLYSYLSKEIVPTIGVGLVGLLMTAGLAGYFFYPFGIARRASDIDRNDRNNYYYKDEYSGGMLEEEAIGQVIAGMPNNNLFTSKQKLPKNNFLNNRYRSNTQSPLQYKQPYKQLPTEPFENVSALFERDYNKKDDDIGQLDDKRFVVGSVQKEDMEKVTPVSIPEHGPRSLN